MMVLVSWEMQGSLETWASLKVPAPHDGISLIGDAGLIGNLDLMEGAGLPIVPRRLFIPALQ